MKQYKRVLSRHQASLAIDLWNFWSLDAQPELVRVQKKVHSPRSKTLLCHMLLAFVVMGVLYIIFYDLKRLNFSYIIDGGFCFAVSYLQIAAKDRRLISFFT